MRQDCRYFRKPENLWLNAISGSAIYLLPLAVTYFVRKRQDLRTTNLAAANERLQSEIAERKRAEQKLRLSEEFLAEGQRLSHTGSWAWQVSSGQMLFSEETLRILGFDAGQAPTFQDTIDRVHPEDQAFVKSVLDAAVRERRNCDFEARLLLPDGSVKHVHAVGHLLDQPGEPEFVGTLMDITDLKRADASLQSAQAQLARIARVTTVGELTASIAHEINQPLAAVVANGNACLRWLAAAEPNLYEARAAAMRIVNEGRRASEVIGRVRALLNKTPPRMSALDINKLIGEVLTLTRNQIFRSGVSLKTELAADLGAVNGDPIQLQQVVLNLVMNGIESTASKIGGPRELLVKSQRVGRACIVVSVKDSGIGIDPADINQIFKPFFTSKPGGMGMGLSISRSIIEAHGGRLWAEPNPDLGSIFRFSLPLFETD